MKIIRMLGKLLLIVSGFLMCLLVLIGLFMVATGHGHDQSPKWIDIYLSINLSILLLSAILMFIGYFKTIFRVIKEFINE